MSSLRKKIFRYTKKMLGADRALSLSDKIYRAKKYFRKGPHLSIDTLVKVDKASFFIHGWVVGKACSPVSIAIETTSGDYIALDDALYRRSDDVISRKFRRNDRGFKPYFTGFVSITSLNLDDRDRLVLKLKMDNREYVRKIRVTQTKAPPLLTIRKILETVPAESLHKRELFDRVYGPAIGEMWNQRVKSTHQPKVVTYNNQLAAPTPGVSLVIPVYGRFDFIDYQLNLFSFDPDMKNHEIIYVIDDPSIVAEVSASVEQLKRLYKIAFTVVYLPENMGYAGSNNVGVSIASSENILLLNSDVMPADHGWLSRLVSSAENVLEHSFVGVRLLYEDDTIQHDGMCYFASPFANDLWTNTHPGKGLHVSLVASHGELVEKEAVTGACLLMRKSIYDSLGGFNEDYILGDYEDSDLCMKAITSGIKIFHSQDINLYHLERQSQSMVSRDRWKDELTYYNCWYHTQQWNHAITQLKVIGYD